MYCPRCGSQNTDTTKFCRQCGLPLAQVIDYVAAGGTGALPQAPPPPPPLIETAEMQALKHKRTLTILSVCIAPIVLAIFLDNFPWIDDFAGIPFLLVPIGIVWARFRYKMELRRLQDRQLQDFYERQQQSMPQQASGPKLIIHAPSNQAPAQPQLAQSDAPRTNPLAEPALGSVVEDETRKFPEH
ncbi:MAG TPA: zinc ribbon domain-containing protein [Blastocatellia bacterium]